MRSITSFAIGPGFGLIEQQLHFTWAEAVTADVIPLLGQRRQRYLDFGVYDFFRDIPKASRAARGLERVGVCLLGQLVQLREADLGILKCMTPAAIEAIRDNLASVGLSFDMYLPLWNRAAQMRVAL
jgi:hypothetical protein